MGTMARQVRTFPELFSRFRQALDPTRIGQFSEAKHALTYHPANGLLTLSLEYDYGKHDAPQFDFLMEEAKALPGYDNREGPATHYHSPQSGRKWVNLHFKVQNNAAAIAAIKAFAKAHGIKMPAISQKPVSLKKKYA